MIPYNEQFHLTRTGPTLAADYREAHRTVGDEDAWVVWAARIERDVCDAGLSYEQSLAKHRAEWRQALGLNRPGPGPVTGPLPRLIAQGAFFALETGERFTAIECSDFNLFGRYLNEGADAIRPVLAGRAAIGFNMLRVWAEYGARASDVFHREIGRLVPDEHPGYYAALPVFLALCSSYGLYVELTAFTGRHIDGHWEQIGAALQGVTNVIVELVNENAAHPADNLVDVNRYRPIPGILCAHGSNGSQALPVRPPWDYETFHTNDAFEWQRKGGHNGMELSQGDAEGNIIPSRKPVLANENTRPDRDGNINHHRDAAAGCALLIAGSCFHSQSGKRSALFSDFDRPFAVAFVEGATSVDLECQAGPYTHPIEEEGPDDLRVYVRPVAGHNCLVRIRR